MQLVLALVVLPPDFLGLPAFRLLAQPPTVDKVSRTRPCTARFGLKTWPD